MPRILLIAGSSGGHLMPVIAVHDALREMHPEYEMRVLCTDRPADQEALRRRRIVFMVMPNLRRRWSLAIDLIRSFGIARRLLRDFRPDAIFSKGGASGLPLCWFSHRRGIPIVIHESDAVIGRANAFASKFATKICLGCPNSHTRYEIRATKYAFTGNPIRPEIFQGKRAEGLRITGFTGSKPILLILGGSQGARSINEVIRKLLPDLLSLCDVIHITGPGKIGATDQLGYWHREFVDEELPHLYACATMALSRAGANTISELSAWGIPAILVPLTGLAQDHQTRNAETAEQTGGCVIVQQEILQEKLIPMIRQLFADPTKRNRMGEGMRSLSNTAAARQIADIVAQTLASQRMDA